MQFNYLVPFVLLGKEETEAWGRFNYFNYIVLDKNADPVAFQEKVRDFLKTISPEMTAELIMQPYKEIYLHSKLEYDTFKLGSYNFV